MFWDCFLYLPDHGLLTRYISHVGMDHFTFKGDGFCLKKVLCTKTIYAFDHCRVSRKSMLPGEKKSHVHSPPENYFQVNERVKSPTIPARFKVKSSDSFRCLAGTDNAFPFFYWSNQYVKNDFQSALRTLKSFLRFCSVILVRRHNISP